MQALNIFTIEIIIFYVIKFDQTALINYSDFEAIGLFIILNILNFPLYNKRKNIVHEYEGLSKKQSVKGQIYFWAYVILSIVIFVVADANLVKRQC